MVSQLQSSNDFDHINYARSFAATQEKPFSCFQFVTHVLAQNAPLAHQELMKNHKIILQNLPAEHCTQDFIPYYYSLLPFPTLKYWKKIEITDVLSGDLLIYIDNAYNPDPLSRADNIPSGTHVAFVDTVLSNNGTDCLKLKLLDSSNRVRGRLLCHAEKEPPGTGCVAYSFAKLLFRNSTNSWDIKFDCQKLLTKKYTYAFRILKKVK